MIVMEANPTKAFYTRIANIWNVGKESYSYLCGKWYYGEALLQLSTCNVAMSIAAFYLTWNIVS